MIYLGIDPGQSGGIAAIVPDGIETHKFKNKTEWDISEIFSLYALSVTTPGLGGAFAFIESVHAMPKQGVSSTFKFGKSYGFLIGLLTAHKIPFSFVTPQAWQKAMGCMTHGDKNISKAAAQRLWPMLKITHAIADAMLIAEHCKRKLTI